MIQAKLTDFGIGQVVSEEYLAGVTWAGFTETMLSWSSSHTGTQLYLAPELLVGEPATTRSDIYSLGVVLYQLLVCAFNRPLTSDWTEEIADPLLRDDLRHCVAGKPAERFAGAGQLAKNLRNWEERKAELARQRAEQAEREPTRTTTEPVNTTRRRWLTGQAIDRQASLWIVGEQPENNRRTTLDKFPLPRRARALTCGFVNAAAIPRYFLFVVLPTLALNLRAMQLAAALRAGQAAARSKCRRRTPLRPSSVGVLRAPELAQHERESTQHSTISRINPNHQ